MVSSGPANEKVPLGRSTDLPDNGVPGAKGVICLELANEEVPVGRFPDLPDKEVPDVK